jgi:hypothetical protein
MSQIENLLSKLSGVKRSSNNSWMCKCPSHDDRNPSLAIKDTGEGKLLLKCMAGCSVSDILGSVGMDFADIMPKEQPKVHHTPPQQVKIYATDALKAIQFEARIVMLAAFELSKGITPVPADLERLKVAMERINTAVEMI